MASKTNWIAFILYISICKSFSTTLGPSTRSDYSSSTPGESTNNASDIIHTSILPHHLTSAPSPEISTRFQETSHINEERSTQHYLQPTIVSRLEESNRDEYTNDMRLTETSSSSPDSVVSNSTTNSDEVYKEGLQVPIQEDRMKQLEKYRYISDEKISYAKIPTKKALLTKESRYFSNAHKTSPSSMSNTISSNSQNGTVEQDWNNFTNTSSSYETAVQRDSASSTPSIVQTFSETSTMKEIKQNDSLKEGSDPYKDDIILQSVTSREGGTSEDLDFNDTKINSKDIPFESDFEENALEYNHTLAFLEDKTFKSTGVSLQKEKKKKSDSNESDSEFSENVERTINIENVTDSSFFDKMMWNASSKTTETSASQQTKSLHIFRKKRSSDGNSPIHTETHKSYITTSMIDSSLENAHSSPTELLNIEEASTYLTKFTNDNSEPAPVTELSFAQQDGTRYEESSSNIQFVTTHLTESTTAGKHNIGSGISPTNPESSDFASQPTDNLKVQAIEAGASPKSASTDPSTDLASGALIAQKSTDQGIYQPAVSTNAPISSAGHTSLENALIPEDTVVSSVPLCNSDEETDLESTSEISIKVFPLCEKQDISKLVSSMPFSTQSMVENSEVPIISGSTMESSTDLVRALNSANYQSADVGESSYSSNINNSYETSSEFEKSVNDPEPSKNKNYEGSSGSESIINGVTKSLEEEIYFTEYPKVSSSNGKFEVSNMLKFDAHDGQVEKKDARFDEEDTDQPKKGQSVVSPLAIKDIKDYINTSLSIDHISNETMKNSSETSTDYVADESEFHPVIFAPRSENISLINVFKTKEETLNDSSKDISGTFTITDTSSHNSSSPYSTEYLVANVSNTSEVSKEISSTQTHENISFVNLLEIPEVDNLTTQEVKISDTGNSSTMETKIAGVGVKTTVSVSLHVSKMNSTDLGNGSRSGLNNTDGPIVTMLNLTANEQTLANKFIKIANDIRSADSQQSDASKNVSEQPITKILNSAKSTENTPSPVLQADITTNRPFSIRKPRVRLNGEDSGSPVSRKPFFVRPPPTRVAESLGPVAVFQKNRTRLGSITSSTTVSTTLRTSRKPYMPRPGTWSYDLVNFSFVPEVETVPTTTQEEVTDDTDTEAVTYPTISSYDTTVLKVPASIVVKKGINCMIQLNNKHSPQYRVRAGRMKKMLTNLYVGSEIASSFWKIEIESFDCSARPNVTVDYNLYLFKNASTVDRQHLVRIINNRLENNTFNRYILEPHGIVFEKSREERINPTTVSPDVTEPPIPQWAIAVIVIGAASLVFIILFGALTVYGRHHMRRRYNGSRLSDDDVDRAIDTREWEDKMAATYENLAADGIYDIEDGAFEPVKRPYRD